MSILNEILGANGGGAVSALAQQFGLSQEQTTAALGQLVPSLNKAMQRNTQSQDGLGGLMAALQGGGHQKYLDQPEQIGRQEDKPRRPTHHWAGVSAATQERSDS